MIIFFLSCIYIFASSLVESSLWNEKKCYDYWANRHDERENEVPLRIVVAQDVDQWALNAGT